MKFKYLNNVLRFLDTESGQDMMNFMLNMTGANDFDPTLDPSLISGKEQVRWIVYNLKAEIKEYLGDQSKDCSGII